jgi:hypothetical protein
MVLSTKHRPKPTRCNGRSLMNASATTLTPESIYDAGLTTYPPACSRVAAPQRSRLCNATTRLWIALPKSCFLKMTAGFNAAPTLMRIRLSNVRLDCPNATDKWRAPRNTPVYFLHLQGRTSQHCSRETINKARSGIPATQIFAAMPTT